MILTIKKAAAPVFLALLAASSASAIDCPFLKSQNAQQALPTTQRRLNPTSRDGDYGVPEGGYAAVREEIAKVLVDSKPFFPADFAPPVGPNYGGLMIRLAWHCAGSFRESDGRGGCDGGRIRFSPELTWPDNANLNMALELLKPVKEKFGASLSWGDLIILAGNTAIETMGGPIMGFCGGRIDDSDGSNSLILGPNDKQEALTPCQSLGQQGRCEAPLGPSTVGLIYVNPAGPVDENGDHGTPAESAVDIRNIFGRMGFTDRETVSLVGGGHAFGKCHGACLEPPCGEGDMQGIGPNTFTSGFEGAWTTRPTTWTNDYFNQLFDFEWELITGPGGAPQWAPTNGLDILMLTADLAFGADADYEAIAREYAADITVLENDFMRSWYHLTTADMGPPERCLGSEVPPPQPWQNVLPAFQGPKPDYVPIRTAIQALIAGDPSNIAAFSNLALICAGTFRQTDYRGGCNGARIRFSPEIDWPTNAGASDALASLSSIKDAYPGITSADLIVLAGNVALQEAGVGTLPFCGGRVDADNANGSDTLAPRFYPNVPVLSVEDNIIVKGLTLRQGVALYATPKGAVLSNQYFIDLKAGQGSFDEYELALLEQPFAPIVDAFIADNVAFVAAYKNAWTQLMTADRYSGPNENTCSGVNDLPDQGVPSGSYAAVREEIAKVLVNSRPFFPADFEAPVGPNYGGLMIRLAWHCAGSFRESDGRGGCDGGRIRFSPELTWPDNANLNMALKLLEPVKEKFGSSLSWGDLIILAGNTAIQTMGGPILGFCGGRVDDADGSASLILGPNDKQEALTPCQSLGQQGRCEAPLGPSTVGLIYVNPAGPVDENGDHGTPAESAVDIRNIFGRMGFTDRETVSLVGGGHAFGKCHGACLEPPCGEGDMQGIGPNTFTSGFEGAWTTRPTTWTNDYFNQLFDFEWELITGPGGAPQWAPTNGLDILMLTADLAFGADADYEAIAREYAADITVLENDFMRSWYHLTTADMGPPERCLGSEVPPPQPWQNVLPAFQGPKPDYNGAHAFIRTHVQQHPSSVPLLSNLALQCASTFRQTDHRGGCNGARIRFSPEIDWPTNEGVTEAMGVIGFFKQSFPEITNADMIVLAGNAAIKAAGGVEVPFCGGRVDADNANGSDTLAPRFYPNVPVLSVEDNIIVKGLDMRQGVALYATPKGITTTLSNQYFVDLKAGVGSFSVYEEALLEEPFAPIVDEFIANNAAFLEAYASAWTYMMTADRFDGPTGNTCTGVDDVEELPPVDPTLPPVFSGGGDDDDDDDSGGYMGGSGGKMMMGMMKGSRKNGRTRRALSSADNHEDARALRGA